MTTPASPASPVYYKVLGAKGKAIHGGNGFWHLPSGKRRAWQGQRILHYLETSA